MYFDMPNSSPAEATPANWAIVEPKISNKGAIIAKVVIFTPYSHRIKSAAPYRLSPSRCHSIMTTSPTVITAISHKTIAKFEPATE